MLSVFVLLSMSVLHSICATIGQYFLSEPSDVIFKTGADLQLPCTVGNKQGACQWTKDGFGLGIDPSLPGFPRFSMGGDDGDLGRGDLGHGGQDCGLHIESVQPVDEGVYQCQVLAVAGVPAIASPPVLVSVEAEPGVPYILQAVDYEVLEVLEGQHVVLDCVSQGARPPADIAWYDGDTVLEDNVKQTVTKKRDSDTFKTHSTLTLVPQDDINIKCSSSSHQFPSTKFSQVLQIKLRYMPKVSIDLSKDTIQEGDKFSVTCNSKAYPENVAYKWFFGGIELAGEKNETLMIENISREHHESDVKCLVENEVGLTATSTTLNVEFPPTILLHPESVVARKGENVTFHCVAESNPDPVYFWTRDRSNILAGYKQNLSLIASDKTETTYVCKVFSDGFEIVSSFPATLTLIRKPVIFTESVRKAREGEDIILQCRVDSASNTTTVVWTKDDDPLTIGNVRFSEAHHQEGRVHQSDLLISRIENKDFGNYGCYAANEVGKDYKTIVLINTGNAAVMSYVAGIAVAGGIVVILSVYLYYRVRKTCEEEDYQEEEMTTGVRRSSRVRKEKREKDFIYY